MTATVDPMERLTKLAGSPWDEKLLGRFREHVEGERELLDAYAEFRDSGPEHVRYLVDLILDDEARHHRVFGELVNRVRSDIDFRDYGPHVPYVDKNAADRAPLLPGGRRRRRSPRSGRSCATGSSRSTATTRARHRRSCAAGSLATTPRWTPCWRRCARDGSPRPPDGTRRSWSRVANGCVSCPRGLWSSTPSGPWRHTGRRPEGPSACSPWPASSW